VPRQQRVDQAIYPSIAAPGSNLHDTPISGIGMSASSPGTVELAAAIGNHRECDRAAGLLDMRRIFRSIGRDPDDDVGRVLECHVLNNLMQVHPAGVVIHDSLHRRGPGKPSSWDPASMALARVARRRTRRGSKRRWGRLVGRPPCGGAKRGRRARAAGLVSRRAAGRNRSR
jgi:hypothetical protein